MDIQRVRKLAGLEPLTESKLEELELLAEYKKVSGAQKSAGTTGGKYNFNGTDYGSASEAKEAKAARIASLTKEIEKLKDDSPMKAPLTKELERIKKADVGEGKADDSKRKEVNRKVYAKSKADIDKTPAEKAREARDNDDGYVGGEFPDSGDVGMSAHEYKKQKDEEREMRRYFGT